jgi:hypothetical protein
MKSQFYDAKNLITNTKNRFPNKRGKYEIILYARTTHVKRMSYY